MPINNRSLKNHRGWKTVTALKAESLIILTSTVDFVECTEQIMKMHRIKSIDSVRTGHEQENQVQNTTNP